MKPRRTHPAGLWRLPLVSTARADMTRFAEPSCEAQWTLACLRMHLVVYSVDHGAISQEVQDPEPESRTREGLIKA